MTTTFDMDAFTKGLAEAARAEHEKLFPNIIIEHHLQPSVYVFAACGYVKVGWSKNVMQREYQLAGGYGKASMLRPADLPKKNAGKLIAAWPGSRVSELRAHQSLAQHRVIGEWFHHNDAVDAWIKAQVTAARTTQSEAQRGGAS